MSLHEALAQLGSVSGDKLLNVALGLMLLVGLVGFVVAFLRIVLRR